MMSFVNEQQGILLQIIDALFVVYKDPITNKKHFRINPELNMEELNRMIAKAREVIVNLYLTCQDDYDEGIDIYKAIVESLSVQLVEKQISALENKKEDLTYLQREQRPPELGRPSELGRPQGIEAEPPNDIKYQEAIMKQNETLRSF